VDKAAMVTLAGVETIPPAMRGPCFFMLQVIFCYLLFWGYMASTRKLHLKTMWVGQWRQIIVAAVGTMASYSLILHVMQTNPVSYIVSLRQSSVLLAVLVGWIQLKEPYGIYRLMTSVVMLAGFYLVSTTGG
jgi:drug/metabolite transporter (DMT)-like permease